MALHIKGGADCVIRREIDERKVTTLHFKNSNCFYLQIIKSLKYWRITYSLNATLNIWNLKCSELKEKAKASYIVS